MASNPSRVAASISGHADALRERSHQRIERAARRALPLVEQVAQRAHEVVETVGIAGSDASESVLHGTTRLQGAGARLADRCRVAVNEHPLLAVMLAVTGGAVAYRSLAGRHSSRDD